jgi:hypothetical protein
MLKKLLQTAADNIFVAAPLVLNQFSKNWSDLERV